MLAEYDIAQDICRRWIHMLCLDPYIVSRPIAFNRPVSEKTVGFDVVLPNGKTIQTAIAYLQSQVFSKPYNIAFYNDGVEEIAHQITYGITERNIYTSLFVHVDDLGLRLPAQIAPEQVVIICRENTDVCHLAANKLQEGLIKRGIRASIVTADSRNNVFAAAIIKGVPLQVIIDESLVKEGLFEFFDRRSLTLKRMAFSSRIFEVIRSTLAKGDEILLEEQTIRKMDYTQTLTPANIAQTHFVPQARNWCSIVTVHEDDMCIKRLQTLGFGEYIGTDQSQKPPT